MTVATNPWVSACQPVVTVPKLFHWPLGRKIDVAVSHSDTCVSDNSPLVEAIRVWLDSVTGLYWSIYSILDKIGDSLLLTKSNENGYCGTLPKRLRKYLASHGHYPTNDQFGQLGSIIGEHTHRSMMVDFTDSLDWLDGDFGDDGSCYFSENGCRNWLPEKLMEHGVYAIRSYDRNGGGNGRALIVPWENDSCVIINAYGHPLASFARIVAQLCGLTYRKVRVRNHGDQCGDFYLNQGVGYVIASDVERYNDDGTSIIDFGLQCAKHCCCNCKASLSEDDAIDIDGDTYCSECCNYCDDCEEHFVGDTCLVHDSRGRSRQVCESCRDADYHQCPCCDKYIAD
jgi:hypothetical protein